MMTAELNRQASEKYKQHQSMLKRLVTQQERILEGSLFGPQRMGGRRSRSTEDMPFKGRTAGLFVPEWLRARLEKWFANTYPDVDVRGRAGGVKVRTLLLLALYQVSKEYDAPAEEAEAALGLEADPKYVELASRSHRP